ncbi:ATP-binding protein [Gordonibacter massiliensis (ex Traore et al. 2017)]|uniref:ATP-binding protein n=1 Tax=Gordonibacter massiliensis (ex Traore et al. 2017) TaxID=1841863 RepID=UPI001C8C4712|nr:ATP-binding protein [Gordonibacter massiliensis (ex Traore et al. 2017)]MBX9035065.1 ATP-binding protein [Gordonibacter massiliensis (ex Traore et al. 2017)]
MRAETMAGDGDLAARTERERARQRRIRASGIPRRYLAASIDRCPEAVQRYASEFNERTRDGLVLHGGVGTGKTYAACAVLAAVADRATVRFATGSRMLRDIRSSYRSGSEGEAEVVARYTGPRLLVIDDLGQEQATDWALSQLLSVIDERQAALKPTVFTTQTDGDGIARRLSVHGDSSAAEAIVSRMRECRAVAFRGPDRRAR